MIAGHVLWRTPHALLIPYNSGLMSTILYYNMHLFGVVALQQEREPSDMIAGHVLWRTPHALLIPYNSGLMSTILYYNMHLFGVVALQVNTDGHPMQEREPSDMIAGHVLWRTPHALLIPYNSGLMSTILYYNMHLFGVVALQVNTDGHPMQEREPSDMIAGHVLWRTPHALLIPYNSGLMSTILYYNMHLFDRV
ncbi:hypothetical protein J6590_005032 [Homalodisca vitripennis]|nr:hypothetical protein J6590_005032 [Homalodisca vitripennis]